MLADRAPGAAGAPPGDALRERGGRRDRIPGVAGAVRSAARARGPLVDLARREAAMGGGRVGGMVGGMAGGMAMPHMQAWRGADLALLVAMWVVMMVAMMLPSAAPLVLLFAGIAR